MVINVCLTHLATLPGAAPLSARYALLLLRRRTVGLVGLLVRLVLLGVAGGSVATTGVGTDTRTFASTLVQQLVVQVVVRAQELAQANTYVLTRIVSLEISVREVPLLLAP